MGMGIEAWIVPLIAIAVWIISSVARSNEQQKLGKGPQRPGELDAAGRQQRRTPSDLDRFLQEIQRRRAEQQKPMPKPEPPKKAPVRREEPARREVSEPSVRAPQPSSTRRRQSRPQTVKPAPSRRQNEELPLAIVVAESPREVQVVAAARLPEAMPTPQPAPVITRQQLMVPAGLVSLNEMLRSPQALISAVVLREIFSPPLCKRGRRLDSKRT